MGLAGTADPAVYEGLRDVLQRQPEVTTVTYLPDSISKRFLRAEIAPERVEPATGPESPTSLFAGRSLVVSAAQTYSSPGYGNESAASTSQRRGFEP